VQAPCFATLVLATGMGSSRILLPLLLAVFAAGSAASAQELAEADLAPPLHVLFIGNSLTYVNDLPGMFTELAVSAGKPRPFVRAVTAPGLSLEDQWTVGEAQKAIAVGGWDFVVLQQGPSASPEGTLLLRAYSRRFADLIRAGGARTVLYMVWPSVARREDFDGVALSYRDAARDVGGILCPAGEAWRAAWKRDPRLELYSPDGLHPTPAGTYLAALTFFGVLYKQSPLGLPTSWTVPGGAPVAIPESRARVLQEAVVDTLGRTLAVPSRTHEPR
jgi:hypothetical protein